MSDDDLRINTLHRFAKHSPRLTLQEYSHCEVPAGCGGVVLRWVDSDGAPTACFRVNSLGTADVWFDGEPLATDRAPFRAGQHVLAIHLRSLESNGRAHARVPVAISVAGDFGPRRPAMNRLEDARPRIERWTPGPQPPAAKEVAFDDHGWRVPGRANARTLAPLSENYQRFFERCINDGMSVLELDHGGTPLTEAWLRISFVLDPSFFREMGR